MRRRWIRGPHWLRPWFSSVASMKETLRYHLHRYGDRPVVVMNMMFHSMEVIAKASPYPQTDGDVSRFLDDLSAVLNWCRGEGIAFAGLGDAANVFRAAHV
jgi:hypothetical protein